MNQRLLSQLADVVGGKLIGKDRGFTRVSTDTRRLAADELFVAIAGERFDAHGFLPAAQQRGAAGALVQHPVAESALPQIVVADTRRALGAYAAHWRRQFRIPVVGVTGSSGKTTLKEMLAHILRRNGATLATRGNMNNDIGLPLTLLELDAGQRAAVIEMGTNHPGEIAYLASITAATIGVITNAGAAHLEFLGSIEGVAREKGALFAALGADGVAVINADDAHAATWQHMSTAGTRHSFGFGETAEFHPVPGSMQAMADGRWQFRANSPLGEADVRLSLPGKHNIANALAALAAATTAGVELREAVAALADVPATAGRLLVVPGIHDCRLVDDSYNANPLSLQAAVEFAVSLGAPVWLVLGDMGELGADAASLHAEAGVHARRAGVAQLLTFGTLSRAASDSFGRYARHFNDLELLLDYLRHELSTGSTLLIKGSRSMKMERVVEALRLQQAVDRAVNGS
ncbi:MAG TPA: UDP-N-acetylmuramoyl-tripeptide--D-alanyl-D-alanine ligase [Gammaproteobacteria bacterium]|nr:UDP-N-acetylmuramoyl-tripeptide--D-alanyl-D-alanine ligase [Gammaproteobacteria bacterium]